MRLISILLPILISARGGIAQFKDRSQFLFVPPGQSKDDGLVLSEVPKESLPPGEYEIVAMFEKPEQRAASRNRQKTFNRQQSSYGYSAPSSYQSSSISHRTDQGHLARPSPPRRSTHPRQQQTSDQLAFNLRQQSGGGTHRQSGRYREPTNDFAYQRPRPPQSSVPTQYDASQLVQNQYRRQQQRHRVEDIHRPARRHTGTASGYPGTQGRTSQRRLQQVAADPRLEREQAELALEKKYQEISDSFFEVSRASSQQGGQQQPPSRQKSSYQQPSHNQVAAAPPTKSPHEYRRPDERGGQQSQNLQKLYQIVESSKEHRNTESRQFQCPRDGHFGDGVDCAKFYRCAHGSAIVEYCPGGLFFNAHSEQCDWPESVNCAYTAETLAQFRLDANKPKTIYLTFDDGPEEGTEYVLKALRNEGVKATLFINSQYLHDKDPHKVARNKNLLLAAIVDGHVIADHSYDHMFHNSFNTPNNAYVSVEDDSKYFGIMNTYPVLDVLWRADLKDLIARTNYTMSTIVRMPYTNNWRVGKMRRDCMRCTVPAKSGQNGVQIADRLAGQGKRVFGWDVEWEINWDTNRFKYAGKDLFFRLAREPRHQNKIVILSHDVAHRPGGVRDEQASLQEFIRLAKDAGYLFDTLDNY